MKKLESLPYIGKLIIKVLTLGRTTLSPYIYDGAKECWLFLNKKGKYIVDTGYKMFLGFLRKVFVPVIDLVLSKTLNINISAHWTSFKTAIMSGYNYMSIVVELLKILSPVLLHGTVLPMLSL